VKIFNNTKLIFCAREKNIIIWRNGCCPGEWRTAGNGRFSTENIRKLEAVFRSGISRIFSCGFRQLPVFSERILPEIIGKIQTEILLPCSRYFPCFPEGSGDFPAFFLRDPVAGMIDLGDWVFFWKRTILPLCTWGTHIIPLLYGDDDNESLMD